MSLLDAPEYDPARDRRRRVRIIGIILVVLIVAGFLWAFRFWPQEHAAKGFFAALQKQDFESAYGTWMHDPDWKQHPDEYKRYPYNEFYRDWGPGGEWGAIKDFKIYWAGNCPTSGSGIVVDVVVNSRAEHAQVYVDKHDKTFGYVPCPLEVR